MRKIEILGHKIEIAFNMAVEIAYEEIAERPFNFADIQKGLKAQMILCYAAIIANNPSTELSLDELLKKASAAEIKSLTAAVIEEMAIWAHVPAVMQEEQQQQEDTEKKG